MENIYKQYCNGIGKIEFGPSIRMRQTAVVSILRCNNTVVISTAAHCIYDTYRKEYNTHICVSFLVDKFTIKYKIDKAYIHRKWIEEGALQYDTAFLLLKNFNSDNYADYAFNPEFSMDLELNYTIVGFPIRFLLSSKKPIVCSGKAILHEKYKNIIQGIKCKAKNGMSGGPWLTIYNNQVVQNSVSSFSFKNNNKVLWGPYWDKEIESVLHVASGIHKELLTVVEKEYKEEEFI